MEYNLIFFLIFGILLLIVYFLIHKHVHSLKTYRNSIDKELNKKNFKLIELKDSYMNDTGPFPSIEFRISFISSNFMGISGENFIYGIVVYEDKNGKINESWVKIETTLFFVRKITWIPELK